MFSFRSFFNGFKFHPPYEGGRGILILHSFNSKLKKA